jgi:hypothetical protein
MINKEKKRCCDPLPIRLAGLAADLARIASSAWHETGAANVAEMLEESQYYIEWTAAEEDPEIAGGLVDIQILIALWRGAWPEAQHSLSNELYYRYRQSGRSGAEFLGCLKA